MKKIIKNAKGITLVALVVTIVVLLILATVTINMAVNNTGIFARAKNATEKYKQAEANETLEMSNLEDEVDNQLGIIKPIDISKLTETTKGVIEPEKQTKFIDIDGKVAVIPKGFCVVTDSPTKLTAGIVISDVAGDDLTNSKSGNQYVWIPCTLDGANGSIKYDRYDFKRTGWAESQTKTGDIIKAKTGNYIEKIDLAEQESITKYGGYYIGRYEAGDGTSTSANTLRTSSTRTTNVVTVKKGQAPYNWLTRDQAKTLAEGIKTENNYTGITVSKLCSSYAWDTALKFVDTIKSGYSTNEVANTTDNYKDLIFTYTDITGNCLSKGENSSTLVPTGETIAVSNIYDLGGNVLEWTTEASSASENACVYRGGSCNNISSDFPAGYRNYVNATISYGLGFRPALYL